MSEDTYTYNAGSPGALSPEVASAVASLDLIDCQLRDAMSYMRDLSIMRCGEFSGHECSVLAARAMALRRQSAAMTELLLELDFFKQ